VSAWDLALIIGLVAALIVAALLLLLIQAVRSIEGSVNGLLDVAGQVAANTSNIPALQATAPVLGEIVTEAVVQDGYMNALTDGWGGVDTRMTTGSTPPTAAESARGAVA
jgi:hypothetical protein